MRLPKFTKLEEVSEYFTELPGVREQLEAKRKEVETTRRAQLKALAAAQKKRSDCGSLGTAHEQAQAAERAAEQALKDAKDARIAAFNAITQHGLECDFEIQRAESALRETADPRIGEFLEWAFAELWEERQKGLVGVQQPNGRDPVTQRERPVTVFSNRESHERRMAALEAAVPAAEALRFVVETDVEQPLAKIKASIPARDLTTQRAGTLPPAMSSVHEPPAEDKPPTFLSRVLGGAGSGR
jgi:hypothetical protein